jgi:ACS family hexuronate transporter-like MFS transporter
MTTEPLPGAARLPTASEVPPAAVNDLPLAGDLADAPSGRASRFRWVVLTLVFFAITINYIDRMVIGLLAPDYLKQPNGPISEEAYGYIGTAFGLSYALGQVVSGRWLDRVGTRVGYAVSLFAWSIASMLHALVRTSLGFGVMRVMLGITESPAYPAATKTLAEWFPRRERAFAMGFVNAGSNVGAVVAPYVVGWLAVSYGWQEAFLATGAAGLVWLAFWLPLYRKPHEHPRVSPAELAHINSDPPENARPVRWTKLLTFPQAWAFVAGKFFTDPIWSFYLFWLPSFLKQRYGLGIKGVMLPMAIVYLMADVGSIGGGWLSSALIKRGWSVNSARKLALLVCAILVVPAVFASKVPGLWFTVAIAGTALAAHQGFSANLYTLVSDMFPKKAVGSVAGLGGMFGYIGFSLFSALTGLILQRWTNKNYLPVFIMCGSAYLVAFALIQLLAPRLERANVDDDPAFGTTPA